MKGKTMLFVYRPLVEKERGKRPVITCNYQKWMYVAETGKQTNDEAMILAYPCPVLIVGADGSAVELRDE